MGQHCPLGTTVVSSSAHSGRAQDTTAQSIGGNFAAFAAAEKKKEKNLSTANFQLKNRLAQPTKKC